MTKPWDTTSEQLLRELAPQVLGAVARRFRDFVSAEDAVQEAMIAAFTQWPQEGIPDNPRGWLIQVASRRLTDQARSEIARRERETAAAMEAEIMAPAVDIESDMDPDDTLILLFMCCHPALTSSSAIALTLRAVGPAHQTRSNSVGPGRDFRRYRASDRRTIKRISGPVSVTSGHRCSS